MLVDKTKGIEQFARPSLLIIAWSIFLLGFFLTLIASTDLFTHKPEGNAFLFLMQISGFWAVFKFTLFYFKIRKAH